MIRAADILFWIPDPEFWGDVAADVADALNWRAPEERRGQAWLYVRAAAESRREGDPEAGRVFRFLAGLLLLKESCHGV